MSKFLAFLVLLGNAFACESVYIPPCEVGSRFEQIFVGTAIEERTASGTFRFRIDESLKGIIPGTKEIEAGYDLMCGGGYEVGERYLVLAYRASGDQSRTTSTGESIEHATESIAVFRALARGEHITVIKGRTAENVEDVQFEMDYEHRPGLPGVEITATEITAMKENHSYTASTDASGSYWLPVPEAGKYQFVAKLAGHASAEPSYELEVAPDSCKDLSLGMWTASHLTGHVMGAGGKPAEGITVQLALASDERSDLPEAKTDVTGKFEFTKLPPGDYVLGVNLEGARSKLPYDTRFYPGVPVRSAARIVKITGAQTIEGLDFQIGERKPTRRIVIAVEWPDGRPVINASVACSNDATRDFLLRYVDMNGEATCEVLADQDFIVEADGLSWKSTGAPIQPIATRPKLPVPHGSDTVRLKFVIDAVNDISASEAPENMAAFNDKDF